MCSGFACELVRSIIFSYFRFFKNSAFERIIAEVTNSGNLSIYANLKGLISDFISFRQFEFKTFLLLPAKVKG